MSAAGFFLSGPTYFLLQSKLSLSGEGSENNFNPLVQFKNKILTYMHNKYKAYLKVNEPKYTNKYLVCRRKVLEKVFTVIYNAIYWNFEYLMT